MRPRGLSTPVTWLLGACLYLGGVVVAFLTGDWGQPLLFLASITAGLVSGRWWSVALAPLIVPAALIADFVSTDEYGGDSVSGPFDAALFVAYFGVLPVAVMIAFGVGLRRVTRLRRNRAVVTDRS